MTLRLVATIAGMGLFASAQAADGDLNFELTPYGAYRFGGSVDEIDTDASYELEDSPSFGIIFNIRQHHNTQWEILYSQQNTDAEYSAALSGNAPVDVDMQTLQGGGTYQGEGDKVRPYLAATLGGTRIKTTANGESESDTFWAGSIGVGLQIRPSERLGLRLEARAYGTLIDSDTRIFCQTGPNQNVCAVQVNGTLLTQIETIAGIVFRF